MVRRSPVDPTPPPVSPAPSPPGRRSVGKPAAVRSFPPVRSGSVTSREPLRVRGGVHDARIDFGSSGRGRCLRPPARDDRPATEVALPQRAATKYFNGPGVAAAQQTPCGHSVVWLSHRLAKSITRVQIPVPASVRSSRSRARPSSRPPVRHPWRRPSASLRRVGIPSAPPTGAAGAARPSDSPGGRKLRPPTSVPVPGAEGVRPLAARAPGAAAPLGPVVRVTPFPPPRAGPPPANRHAAGESGNGSTNPRDLRRVPARRSRLVRRGDAAARPSPSLTSGSRPPIRRRPADRGASAVDLPDAAAPGPSFRPTSTCSGVDWHRHNGQAGVGSYPGATPP